MRESRQTCDRVVGPGKKVVLAGLIDAENKRKVVRFEGSEINTTDTEEDNNNTVQHDDIDSTIANYRSDLTPAEAAHREIVGPAVQGTASWIAMMLHCQETQ